MSYDAMQHMFTIVILILYSVLAVFYRESFNSVQSRKIIIEALKLLFSYQLKLKMCVLYD